MWAEDVLLVELVKSDRGLGFSILDYQVNPISSYMYSCLLDLIHKDPVNRPSDNEAPLLTAHYFVRISRHHDSITGHFGRITHIFRETLLYAYV